jgi:Fe-S cluster assembly iron-binding protein IscA
MALDELKKDDAVYDIDGFQYIVNKEFLEKAKPIKVDFLVHGFKLDCGINFSPATGCAGCGTSDACC